MANSTILSSVSFGANVVATVQSAQMTSARNTIEVTEIGDGNAKFVYGIINSTASLEVFFDKSDHSLLTAQMLDADSVVVVTLTWNTGAEWTGDAFVNSIAVTAASGDVVKATIQLQFTGAVTI